MWDCLCNFQIPTILQVIFVTVMNKIVPFIFKTAKKMIAGPKGEPELQVKEWKKDVVYLVQFPRSPTVPNLSPFCIKIETFLRANSIKYEVVETISSRSKHHLLPYIELNGHQIADSQLIIIKLKEYFKIKDYKNAKDDAIGRAISRTCEHHTFHVINFFKILENPTAFAGMLMTLMDNAFFNLFKPLLQPIIGKVFQGKVRNRIGVSLGLFPKDTMKDLLHRDLQMFEDLLAENKYFFGDKVTEADITVFSHFAVTVYVPLDSYPKQIIKEGKQFPRVSALLQHIRDDVWGNDFEKH
jgi:hypothetical protein